jgi:DNA-binding response OmpR family regulator
MKVLVIEDDPDVAEFISLALSIGWPDIETVIAETGEMGIRLAQEANPDVVTVDLGLPDRSGFEVIKAIRAASQVPIIVLTVRGEERDIVKGLELGADEYVVKPFGQMELIARIRALVRRQQNPEEDSPVVCGKLSLDVSRRTVRLGEKEALLTGTECAILKLLIGREGAATSHALIGEKIWGNNVPEAADVIKVHVRHLREKIELDPGHPRIILTRFGIGYYLIKPA